MPRFRLAFVLSMYFPYGGLQRDLYRIATACAERGHEVHIYTGSWSGPVPDNLQVHELDTRARTNHRSNEILAEKVRQEAEGKYDCVIGFTKLPGLDLYYAADPCYAARCEQTKSLFYHLLPRYRAFKEQEEAVFRRGAKTGVLLIAHGEEERFMRYYGTEPERFKLLPPGIDRQGLIDARPTGDEREALRAEFNIAPGDLMLLAVGSRFRTKGVDRLIRAVASLSEDLRGMVSTVVVGEGDAVPLRKLAKKLGVDGRLHFTGARDDVAKFYYSADLLAHGAYSENTGTVLIEAMVCGLPVLATGVCGFVIHVAKAKAGLVCPEPFRQGVFNMMLKEALTSHSRYDWQQGGLNYCRENEVDGLVPKAVEAILERAEQIKTVGRVSEA